MVEIKSKEKVEKKSKKTERKDKEKSKRKSEETKVSEKEHVEKKHKTKKNKEEKNGSKNGTEKNESKNSVDKDDSEKIKLEAAEYYKSNGITIIDVVTGERITDKCIPVTGFTSLHFDKLLIDASCKGFTKPTPIQATCWSLLTPRSETSTGYNDQNDRDIVGVAETGSGKTMAFALPALQQLLNAYNKGDKTGTRKLERGEKPMPQVLVLAPTRELAMQTQEQFENISESLLKQAQFSGKGNKNSGFTFNSVCLYGGNSKYEQKKKLYSENPNVVVATPGRLIDLMENGDLILEKVEFLCLDEADRMLDQGFERAVRSIIESTIPKDKSIQKHKKTVMFSATWPVEIRKLANEFLVNPIRVNVRKLIVNSRVEQTIEVMDPYDKETRIQSLLNQLMKTGNKEKTKTIVFVLYKKEATRVEMLLQRNGYNCCSIHGDKTQDARISALSSFKTGKVPILIATDVAARGLDIPNVEYVINFTFPLTIDDYIHRIGRTGRAGKKGSSITFFTFHDKHHSGNLINVLKQVNMNVPENLLKFGTTVKKKEHKVYGAFYKDVDPSAKPTKIVFD
ncbi:hypothetical protein BB559_002062 [Furculomyces boomerangus]|uniref:RNA helicase n=2 Tax=Harpellales TaxID=61421 RepID=A0A2T9YYD4_9FUNG|nr:hypothetical protein BB559_002062 [Furculomyces boomerangus]PWA02179.1 hypothetical protein BB558_001699 [Smittium angustum]